MAFKKRSGNEDKFFYEDLDLSGAGMVDIPLEDIAYFPWVSNISLSNNHIRFLTADFPSMLRQLVHLDLSRNHIKKLPENFGLLVNLRELDLHQNQLERLPVSISKLKKLSWLNLKDNPLVPTLRKVAGCYFTPEQCAKRIVGFMNKIEEKFGEQYSAANLDWQVQQKSFSYSTRTSQKYMRSQCVQEPSSNDEQETLSQSRDKVVTTKRKKIRKKKKKTYHQEAGVMNEFESAGIFKEFIIWLLRSAIWLLLFVGVFFLLCSLSLTNSGLKNVLSVISSNEELNQYLLRRHEWIQSDVLNRAAFSTVRDYGKYYFAIFVNYFNTLVESVVQSICVITNLSGK